MAWKMAVPTSYVGLCKVTICLYLFSTFTHLCLIASAIELMFLQAIPGNVNEDEANITLPIMMNIVPPNASLHFDVVVKFSVAGGAATSKNTISLVPRLVRGWNKARILYAIIL